MTHGHSSARGTTSKLLLLVGFLALAVAVTVAYRNPASVYELSVYEATPPTYWVGVYTALFVGLVLALLPGTGRLRTAALLLGGSAVASIVALPVIRGYHFYGTADPLTHLGWVRDLSAGTLDTFTFIYPGFHGLVVVLNRIGGYQFNRGVLVAVFLFAVLFVIFAALTARTVSGRAGAGVVGAFSAFAFLPVNSIDVHLRAHPFSQTTLLAAIVLFLLAKYVTDSDVGLPRRSIRFAGVSPYGVLLAVAGISAVLYHPLAATDLLVILGIVCAVQFLVRRRWPTHPIAAHRPVYAPTAVVAIAYAAWSLRTDWFFGAAGRHTDALLSNVLGGGIAGERIASQGTSIVAIGGSIPEIVAKLFAVNLAYGLLAALLVVLVLAGRIARDDSDTPELVTYLAAGGAGVAALIVVYLFANVSEMYFRHLGVLSLIVTVLGAVALLEVGSALSSWATPGRIHLAFAIWFALVIPLGLATAYQSPYIHKASQHVTEAHMDGYEFAFDQAERGDLAVLGVRVAPDRFSDAVHGTVVSDANLDEGRWDYERTVSEGELSDLQEIGPGYVIVTSADRQREVVAYRELRYDRAGFQSLDAQVGVNRVHSTEGADLYLVS